jgi:hypothetical protein
MARELNQAGYDVCVLDADSTNAGLHGALGLQDPPAPLLEFFGGAVFSGGRVTCPVDDPARLQNARVSLADLPERYVARSPDGIWLLVLGKLGVLGPGAGCDGPIAKIARDVEVSGTTDELVTLIDMKAGFEDSARGVVTGVDWAVVVVDPTRAAIGMARDMSNLVYRLRHGARPATEHLPSRDLVELAHAVYRDSRARMALVVLNRIPDPDTEQLLRDDLLDFGLIPVAAIHEDRSVNSSWYLGAPLVPETAGEDIEPLISALEARAASTLETAESAKR